MAPTRALKTALEAVQRRLNLGPRLRRRLAAPDFGAIREFVRLLDKSIVELNQAAGLEGEEAQFVRRSVLQGSFLVLVSCRHLRPRLASDLLVSEWKRVAEFTGVLETDGEKAVRGLDERVNRSLQADAMQRAQGSWRAEGPQAGVNVPSREDVGRLIRRLEELSRKMDRSRRGRARPARSARRIEAEVPPSRVRLKAVAPDDQEFLAPFNTAVFLEALVDRERERHGPESLRRLATQLELSQDQLGRMLGVSGETVRRWQGGSHRVPIERSALLTEAESALGRLLEMFRPERLTQVIRRRADLFDGETALDWILRGRIKDVANRYETALAYQA